MNRIFSIANGKIWCGIQRIDDHSAKLCKDEYQLVSESPLKRIKEFSTGRILSRTLLSKYNIAGIDILTNEYGAPVWPNGIMGSISHSGDLCFVAITDLPGKSIGVDVQKILPVSSEFSEMVLTKSERILSHEAILNIRTNMIFSVKESVFKSLAFDKQLVLDFCDVETAFNGSRFFAHIPKYNLRLEGMCVLKNGYVFSGLLGNGRQ